ncbi:MAG: porin, partial [Flavobacteriales bacterium]
MKKLYLATLISALSASVFAAPAPADLSSDTVISTKGGFEIKNDLFSAKIGGRIHFDGRYVNEEDDLSAASQATNSNTAFRRARITLEGKAYGWGYKFENDFAGQSGTTGSGLREMWISTQLMDHNVRFGQAKPYRGM